ncbi:MAG: cell envelope integrity protein TolA [Bacteroidia bacterium]
MKKQFPTRLLGLCATTLLLLAILTAGCSTNTAPNSDSAASALPPQPVDMQKLMAPFAPPTQTFTVSGKKPSTVIGDKGTILHINPANLQMPDGSPITDKIEVSLVECTDKAAIIGAGLQTVSDGKLLASGGSYFIGMKSSGQELSLQSGKTLNVEFPQVVDQGMELFYGERTSDGQVNWVAAKKKFKAAPEPTVEATEAGFTFKSDTTYMYVSGNDTVVSDDITDIYAFIDGESAKPDNKRKAREEAMRERRLQAENARQARNAANQQAMMARRQQSESAAKTLKAAQKEQELYASIGLNRLGWINCDRFYNETNKAEIAVETQSTGNPIIAYYVLRDINSMISSQQTLDPNKLYPQSLPVGQQIEVICLSQNQETGDYAFAAKKLTVEENTTLHFDLKPATTTEIKKVLSTI